MVERPTLNPEKLSGRRSNAQRAMGEKSESPLLRRDRFGWIEISRGVGPVIEKRCRSENYAPGGSFQPGRTSMKPRLRIWAQLVGSPPRFVQTNLDGEILKFCRKRSPLGQGRAFKAAVTQPVRARPGLSRAEGTEITANVLPMFRGRISVHSRRSPARSKFLPIFVGRGARVF